MGMYKKKKTENRQTISEKTECQVSIPIFLKLFAFH